MNTTISERLSTALSSAKSARIAAEHDYTAKAQDVTDIEADGGEASELAAAETACKDAARELRVTRAREANCARKFVEANHEEIAERLSTLRAKTHESSLQETVHPIVARVDEMAVEMTHLHRELSGIVERQNRDVTELRQLDAISRSSDDVQPIGERVELRDVVLGIAAHAWRDQREAVLPNAWSSRLGDWAGHLCMFLPSGKNISQGRILDVFKDWTLDERQVKHADYWADRLDKKEQQ